MNNLPITRTSLYFNAALLLFIASFVLLPTTKMVNNVYYMLLALPALFVLLTRRGRVGGWSADLLLWGLLLGWFAIVGIWSGDAQHYKHILYVALFILAVTRLVEPSLFQTPWFSRCLFWTLLGYVLGSAVVYWATGRYEMGERVIWLPSRMTGPIYTSLWIACCFALTLPVWLRQQRWLELSAALLLALFCIGYVLQSRSGLVALVAVLLLVAGWAGARRPRVALAGVTVVLLCGALLAVSISEVPELARLLERADAGRLHLWQVMLTEWRDCGLLLGCGMDHRTEQLMLSGEPIPHPHSIFLSLGVFSGLVGVLIFLVLMGVVIWRAWLLKNPWGLYLLTALIGLNFDGTKLIGNPDELWLLVLLPACLIGNPRGGAAARAG